MQDVTVWHYMAGLGLFCCVGLAAHLCRAIFNPVPDLPARVEADVRLRALSRLFGTDYDPTGHYRMGSLKNLGNAVALSACSGLMVMLVSADVAALMARVMDQGMAGLAALLVLPMHASA